MNIIRHWNFETELLHWLLILVAALLLVIVVVTALGGADPTKEPLLLPKGIDTFAKPMPLESVKPFFPESTPVRKLPPAEAAARLWTILENHRADRAQEALNDWFEMGLPQETAHWRETAMAAAYLQIGDLNRAALHLEAAYQLMPEHAIVAYFTGLLRLEQAMDLSRVPDGRRRSDLLVSYTPMEDRALYRMLAGVQLELAIARALEIRSDEPLVPAYPPVDEQFISPTVGDLLTALGANNFVGKAHHTLFGLRLDEGELAIAEYYLDRAAETGIAILHGYRDLAERYLIAEENRDALRVCLKDFKLNYPDAHRIAKWLLKSDGRDEGWVW